MNYLAIDTSGKNLTVLICEDGKIFKFNDSECGVNHSVELMVRVEELAEKCQFDFKKANFFVAVTGAGSFTGIRIGVATVKALCFAFNKPCLAVTSFDTLAYNTDGKVLSLIDAKHNAFYVCGYENYKVNLEPCYLMREKVEELLDDYDVVVASSPIENLSVKVCSIPDGLQKAIELNLDKVSSDLETLSPLYVRKSQAEEGR